MQVKEYLRQGLQLGRQIESASAAESFDELETLLALQRDIKALIQKVPHPTQRLILYDRYVRQLHWHQIANAHHYCEKWVYELHNRGLESLERNP